MRMADGGPDEAVKPFLEHLEDLRITIIRCAIALAVGMAIAFPLAPAIFGFLKQPLRAITDNPDTFLRSMEVVGAFSAVMRIGFWSGFVLSLPALVIIVGAFVMPALTPGEKSAVYKGGIFSVGLFFFGVFLGYRFTLPFAVGAMFSVNRWIGVQAEWTINSYISFVTQLLAAFGLAFQIPVAILILGRIGILSSSHLRKYRRHAIFITLVIAAVLTPPDVFSMMIMSVPLYILYELCVWIIWMWEKSGTVKLGRLRPAAILKRHATAEDPTD
jgi:sec-independent protein translocase protein TatC